MMTTSCMPACYDALMARDRSPAMQDDIGSCFAERTARLVKTIAQLAYQVAFQSVYFSIAWIDLSRPCPDCLKPPNGTDMLPRSKQFTQTTPARTAFAALWALRISFVQMPAASP